MLQCQVAHLQVRLRQKGHPKLLREGRRNCVLRRAQGPQPRVIYLAGQACLPPSTPREKTCTYPSRYVYLGRLMPDASVCARTGSVTVTDLVGAFGGTAHLHLSARLDLDCQCSRSAALNLRICVREMGICDRVGAPRLRARSDRK